MEITVTTVTVGRSYCWNHLSKPYFSFHMSLISLSNGFEIYISYSVQTSAQIILSFKLLLFLYWHFSSRLPYSVFSNDNNKKKALCQLLSSRVLASKLHFYTLLCDAGAETKTTFLLCQLFHLALTM